MYLFNGTFDQSENVITRDRITKAMIIGPDYKVQPLNDDYYDKDKATYLKFKAGSEGTYVAGISTLPNIIELGAKDFNEYLDHEGLADVIAERNEKGLAGRPAIERYAKHVKALIQVADQKTNHYATELGYPVEFIPMDNPYDLKPGDQLSIKLLNQGKPLGNQTVHYSCRTNSESSSNGESSLRTDENGVFSINLNTAGKWYVATIHMTESDQENIDYISNWATCTFEIK